MGSTRKPRCRADDEPLAAALRAALTALRETTPRPRIAVAVSGGRDSVALLDALCAAGVQPVAALTIHHGLSPDADRWVACAADHARRLGVPHAVHRAAPGSTLTRGVEEAARLVRYDALDALCARHGADVLALAHHLDDMAETVLLQALRGSGPAGLAAMPALQRFAHAAAWRWRPLLEVPRAAIEAYVAQRALAWCHDASNDDTRFARNALRHRVLPAIAQHFPAYRRTLSRLARLAAQAEAMLDEVAQADLAAVSETHPALGEALRRGRWLALTAPRRARVLRLWLARAGLRAPSHARLEEMQRQLERAAPDAAVLLTHQARHVRRWRDWIVLDRSPGARVPGSLPAAMTDAGPCGDGPIIRIDWRGQPRIELPMLHGALLIDPETRTGAFGVAHEALAAGAMTLRARRGRERIRLSLEGPGRTLKNVFQERGVPAWQRARLPIAHLGERLLWVADVGFDARAAVREGARYSLRWEPLG